VRIFGLPSNAGRIAFGVALLCTQVGCGGVLYTARVNSVEAKIEAAKEVGAEASAPYEYYSAKARYEKAREEAGRADYGDALDLLDEAEKFAAQAVDHASAVRKGAGR
jgi:hypothetical protein